MRLRITPSGKGWIALVLAILAFMLGTNLQLALLNLCGYFLVAVLVTAVVLGILEVRGVTIQAVAGTEAWVRITSPRRAGPFGLSVSCGKRWSEDRPVTDPDPGGQRMSWPQETRALGRVRVRLRAFPLGLVAVRLEVSAEPIDRKDDEQPDAVPAGRQALAEPFGGVREHRPGEGLRDVHWRASARRQSLLVRLREPELEPAARAAAFERSPVPLAVERRTLLHGATCLAALFAVGFAWALGAIPAALALGAAVLHSLGAFVSARRSGRPGWPLLIVLYVGVLSALGGFLWSLRQPPGTPPAMAGLLVAVIAIFTWDLRNRLYLRAQQLNTFLVLAITPAMYPPKDTALVGLMFAACAGMLVLASWADGRHEIGIRRVTLRDLRDLPSAWLPIGMLALIALLIHPWLPALALPHLPTFGTSLAQQRGRSQESRLPGQSGAIDLGMRWPERREPVIRIQDPQPMRLRVEALGTYRDGFWFRSDLKVIDWPTVAAASHPIGIRLLTGGMTMIPLPESAVGLEASGLRHTLYLGRIAESHMPLDRGFTFQARVPEAPWSDTSRPTRSDTSVLGLPRRLLLEARRLSGAERSASQAMRAMTLGLQRLGVYDLEAPVAPAGTDPTLYFLETSHRGFCVHFASALALMGRELGIPTRLVTGYARGSVHGAESVVLASDAHAWVEAYVDGRWESFDPTPAGTPHRAPSELPRLLTIGALVVGLAVYGYVRRPRTHPATLRYRSALRRLARRGVRIPETASPEEVLVLAASTLSDSELLELGGLTRAYEAERFGPARTLGP